MDHNYYGIYKVLTRFINKMSSSSLSFIKYTITSHPSRNKLILVGILIIGVKTIMSRTVLTRVRSDNLVI